MGDERCRLDREDVVIGLDLASAEHQVVVLTAAGQRLTRFRIPHSRAGLEELLRRTAPAGLGRAGGRRLFAFEATGHVWEAVAYVLRARGERYVVVNPLATHRTLWVILVGFGPVVVAALLGSGSPLVKSGSGSLFSLALPVSRRRWIGTRAGLGLAELFVVTLAPSVALAAIVLAPALALLVVAGAPLLVLLVVVPHEVEDPVHEQQAELRVEVEGLGRLAIKVRDDLKRTWARETCTEAGRSCDCAVAAPAINIEEAKSRYLDNALKEATDHCYAEGRNVTRGDLYGAIIEGGTQTAVVMLLVADHVMQELYEKDVRTSLKAGKALRGLIVRRSNGCAGRRGPERDVQPPGDPRDEAGGEHAECAEGAGSRGHDDFVGAKRFRDLGRDSRFCLHTATVDPQVGDGDVKLFGRAQNSQDKDLHAGFAEALFEETGMDLRGEEFDPFYVADLTGASSIELEDKQLRITIWKPGEGERVVHKT